MNKRMILYILSTILLIEAAFMLLPLAVAAIYREAAGWYFLYTILGTALLGLLLRVLARPKNKTIYAKDGLITVALSWIVLSLVGALPFALSGEIPSYLDAVFETISGFTTTGSSILSAIAAPRWLCVIWRRARPCVCRAPKAPALQCRRWYPRWQTPPKSCTASIWH